MDLRPITGIGLCAGVGWLDLGVKLAFEYIGFGYRTVCFCERDSYAASVLMARMEDSSLEPAAICDSLEDIGIEFRGVDCLVAGFPCQPWSVAGSRKGTADDRWIWPDIIRVIRRVEPRFVMLENVPGLLAGDGAGIGSVLDSLAELRFHAEWCHLSAAAVGASHKRERWFCVAYRSGMGDTIGARLQERRSERGNAGEELATAERNGTPIFAPGPGDTDAWQRILREQPWLAPAIGKEEAQSQFLRATDGSIAGMDDPRADRLRCIGNGVVCLQAASAFVGLMRRLNLGS